MCDPLSQSPYVGLRRFSVGFTEGQKREIYTRDGGVCQLRISADCSRNRVLREGEFHIDHILPLSRGGSNLISNGQVSCPSCNLQKGNKLIS